MYLYKYLYYFVFIYVLHRFWMILNHYIYILCFLHAWNCFPIGRCMRVYMMCLFFVEWFSLHFVYCRKMPKLGRKCRKLFFFEPHSESHTWLVQGLLMRSKCIDVSHQLFLFWTSNNRSFCWCVSLAAPLLIIHRHLGFLFDSTFFHDVQGGHVQHRGSRYMVDSRLLFVSLTVRF